MGFAVDQTMGQWQSWKEPAGCLVWHQSTGQGSFCPLPLVRTSPGPASPTLQLRSSSHSSPVWMKTKLADYCYGLPGKKNSFPKDRGGNFEKAGNSFGISPKGLVGFRCEYRASLTLGHQSLRATDGGNAFKETMENITVHGISYLRNFSAVSFERYCSFPEFSRLDSDLTLM